VYVPAMSPVMTWGESAPAAYELNVARWILPRTPGECGPWSQSWRKSVSPEGSVQAMLSWPMPPVAATPVGGSGAGSVGAELIWS